MNYIIFTGDNFPEVAEFVGGHRAITHDKGVSIRLVGDESTWFRLAPGDRIGKNDDDSIFLGTHGE